MSNTKPSRDYQNHQRVPAYSRLVTRNCHEDLKSPSPLWRRAVGNDAWVQRRTHQSIVDLASTISPRPLRRLSFEESRVGSLSQPRIGTASCELVVPGSAGSCLSRCAVPSYWVNEEAIARASGRFGGFVSGGEMTMLESLTTRQGVRNGRDQWLSRKRLSCWSLTANSGLAFLQCHVDLIQNRHLSASPTTNHCPSMATRRFTSRIIDGAIANRSWRLLQRSIAILVPIVLVTLISSWSGWEELNNKVLT